MIGGDCMVTNAPRICAFANFHFIAYLWQLFEFVGIEKQLLQAPAITEYLVGHSLQGAMTLVHRLDVAVTAPQGDTLQHLRPPQGEGHRGWSDTPHRTKTGGGCRLRGGRG